mmetsp:Transcript_54656/g.97526  ORF Transcript_54656/g.97526 Transcript_54656/m.97526 type:complete len:330 (-) Transcript_54656:154-1143(-)
MGGALSSCQNVIDAAFIQDDEELASALAGQYGPQLLLRVDAAPLRDGPGVHRSPFQLTDEVTLECLEPVPRSWAPLSWRFDRSAKVRRGEVRYNFPWPQGDRFSMPYASMRARVEGTNKYVLLQVCSVQKEQTMERVVANMQDSKEVAYHAENFNKYIAQSPHAPGFGHDAPNVRVCAPVGCRVLDSRIPQLVNKGGVVTITDYPAKDVDKFIFDGTEQFMEIPQAFFHHVTWATAGSSMLFDLQGSQTEDGDVLLVDPCVLRASKVGVGDIFAAATSQDPRPQADGPTDQMFEVLHRQCGQLCKGFDPNRRGAKVRRMCGVPSCGPLA